MKIILTQPEIEQALKAYVLDSITLKDGSDPSIEFSATRGADGLVATIDVSYLGVKAIDLNQGKASNPLEALADAAAPVTAPTPAPRRRGASQAAPVTPPAATETVTPPKADAASPAAAPAVDTPVLEAAEAQLGDGVADEVESVEDAGSGDTEVTETEAPPPASATPRKSLFDLGTR